MLDSPESAVILDSLNKIIQKLDAGKLNLTRAPSDIPTVLNAGYLEKIFELLNSSDEKVVKGSIVLAAMLSETSTTVHSAFAKNHLIDKFIQLLGQQYSAEVQDESASILSNISKNSFIRTKIRQLNGIKALIQCIKVSTDPDVLKNSSEALYILMQDDLNKKEVYHLDGLKSLVQLMSSSYNEIQKNGLLCLIRIAYYYPASKDLQNDQVQSKLFDIIRAEKLDLPQLALELIAFTLSVGYHLNRIQTSTLVKFIQSLEQAPTNDTMIIHTARIISILSKHAYELIIYKENWVNSVLGYVDKSSKPTSCFQVIDTLLSIQYIGDRTGFSSQTYQQICKRLWAIITGDQKIEDKSTAIQLFAKLSNEAKLDKIKFDQETINTLIGFLKDQQMKQSALGFFVNVNLTEEYFDSLSSNGVYSFIAKDLEQGTLGPEFVDNALFLLSVFTQDPSTSRKQSIKSLIEAVIPQIDQILVKSLNHENESIQIRASNAAVLLLQSGILSLNTILSSGLVRLVESKKDDSSKFGRVWSAILEYYPTFSYAFTGKLSVKINGLFLDAGKSNLEKLKPLNELLGEKLNANREILVVDSQADYNLNQFIQTLTSETQELDNFDKLVAIAQRVSKRMGGPITTSPWNGYKSHIFQLKKQKNSNCINLGDIKVGTLYHRALLFKIVCDLMDIPCELSRGDKHQSAWNIVSLYQQDEKMMQKYVVDLSVGRLVLGAQAKEYIQLV